MKKHSIRMWPSVLPQMINSLVCHLLSVPAEGAVECRRLFAAQRFSETTVELTEAPQTRDKLPAADREEIEKE